MERNIVKKLIIWIALAGLLGGCSWVSGTGRDAPEGASTESWRGTGGISTGADAGSDDR